jgi:hypothetical protein
LTTALVIGCAAAVWEEVKLARRMHSFDRTYCVKMMGVYYPKKFDTWVSLHPEFMDDYAKKRSELGLPNGYEIVCPLDTEVGTHGRKGHPTRQVSYRWPGMNASASSGIYGAKVALDDGCDRVVLAGIPMNNDPHFARKGPWQQTGAFLSSFAIALPYMLGKVRSMSGLTMEKLGAPTPEWLAGR